MEDTRTFEEVLAAVKYDIVNKYPIITAKEEFVEDVINDAVELFGYDFIYGTK